MISLAVLRRLLKRGSYSELKALLQRPRGLAQAWPSLEPLQKLTLFKLMDPQSALDFYGGLPYAERYFLFCGAPLGAIAPVLEPLGLGERRLFHQLPRDHADRMYRALLS